MAKYVKQADMLPTWNGIDNDPDCYGCSYYTPIAGGHKQLICSYILRENHMRGCAPGKDCTRRTNNKVRAIPDEWRVDKD